MSENTTTTTTATTTTTKTTITKTLTTTTTPLVTIPLKTTPLTTAVSTTKTIAITSPPVCKFGNTYLYTDLKGGLVSGNFLDRGLTSGIKPCMELCCAHRTCDLAYVVSGRCYLVECYTEDLCSIVPKGIGLITPTIGMVVRPNGPKIPELAASIGLRPPSTDGVKQPQRIKPPESLSDMNELELELGGGTKPMHKCKFKKTLNHTAFVGGLRAGNFTNKGTVVSMGVCQDLCCKELSCDVAVMMKHACFLVACRSEELCKPRKAHLPNFSLHLSYRDRKEEKDDDDVSSNADYTVRPPTVAINKPTKRPVKKTTTTKKPSATTKKSTTLSHISNDTSVKLPEALTPHKDVKPWCLTSFILDGVELNDGLKSGPYREFGIVADMNTCMQKCCNTSDCTTAYFENSICYGIRCLDKKSCAIKIGNIGQSVGYVVRNGWSLFQNQSEAMKDATVKQENVLNEPNVFPVSKVTPSISHPIFVPKVGQTASRCQTRNKLLDHRFTAGVKAGVFTDHGEVSDFESCVTYCCKDTSCNVAYMVDRTCYSVKCYTSKSCETFSVPKFFLNPIISFIERNGDTINVISDVKDSDYGLTHHNYTVTLIDAKKPVDEFVHYSDHEDEPLHDKIIHRKTHHHNKPPQSHFNKGTKRSKQKQHTIKGNKKIEVPTGALIKKLVHQIISEDSSGSGENPIGLDMESTILESLNAAGVVNKKKHHQHKHRHKKKRKFLHRRHHKKKHHKKHHSSHKQETMTIATTPTTTTTTAEPTTTVIPTTQQQYYPLSMTDLDIDTIRALSAEKEYTSCNANVTECEHMCINLLHGGYRCMCRKGYQLALDGKHCLYQGECNPKTFHCDHSCRFTNNDVKCQCRSGYVMMKTHDNKCKDMDECAMGIHSCSDICVNTPGSYTCQCNSGQQLSADRMTCEAFSESSATKKSYINRPEKRFTIPAMIVSTPKEIEIDQGRNILLKCKTKGMPIPQIVWAFNESTSSLIKEDSRYNILPGGSLLIEEAKVNDTGQYICISSNTAGTDTFEIYLHVNDVNECKNDIHRCEQICINTYGSFQCACRPGYTLMADQTSCKDMNECENVNGCQQYCFNTPGSYQCGCQHGYTLHTDKRHCKDINECIDKSHDCMQICNNTIGGYLCACTDGYELSKHNNKTCDKITHHAKHSKFSLKITSTKSAGFIIMVTSVVLSLSVFFFIGYHLINKYKNRISMSKENTQAPRITTRSSAIYSWD